MTGEGGAARSRIAGRGNPTPPSTTGPAAPGVSATVKDARSKSLNKQPQHPATGRFVKRNGGRRGQ